MGRKKLTKNMVQEVLDTKNRYLEKLKTRCRGKTEILGEDIIRGKRQAANISKLDG